MNRLPPFKRCDLCGTSRPAEAVITIGILGTQCTDREWCFAQIRRNLIALLRYAYTSLK